MQTLGLFGNIGWQELLILLAIALLLFGSRLPEVARSMGKAVIEFKKGLKGVEEDVNNADSTGNASSSSSSPSLPPRSAYQAPVGASGEDVRVSAGGNNAPEQPR